MNNANCAGSISEPLKHVLKQLELSAPYSLRGPSLSGFNGGQIDGPGAAAFVPLTGGPRGPLPPAVQPGLRIIPALKANPVKRAQPLLTVEKARDDLLLNVLTAAAASQAKFGAVAMPPIMLPRDHSAERSETTIEGQLISCFEVGGEKRLCLPQLLNAVLRDFSLPEINKACAELHVHCSQCSKEQLEILKAYQVLPISAVTCGLITKSDAERLTSYLFQSRQTNVLRSNRHLTGSGSAPRTMDSKMSVVGGASTSGCCSSGTSNVSCSSSSSLSAASVSSPASACSDVDTIKDKNNDSNPLPVYHECFGRCRGKFKRELYQKANSDCIECDECGCLFAPHRFVLHSHRNHETKTCHWGFDSENWRLYLHLSPEMENSREAEKILEEEKAKFSFTAGQQQQHQQNSAKRSLDRKHLIYPFDEKRPRLDAINGHPGLHPLPTVPDYLASLGAGRQLKSAASANTAANLPFLMYDPLTIYHAVLANARSFAPSSLLPFVVPPAVGTTQAAGGLPFAPHKSADVGQLAIEEAADALLKLAPPTATVAHADSRQKMVPMVSIEPLKKHILHRTQLKLSTCVPAAATNSQGLDKIPCDKSAPPKFSGADDIGTINLLLNHYVKDPEGLRMIRAKLDETRRNLDGKMDCLSSQNRILQQEIAYLRNKRTSSSGTSSAILTTVSP